MSTPSYQPAADETIAQFAELLFNRLFFQSDVALVSSTWAQDIAEDVFININGTTVPGPKFLELVKGFHATCVAKLEKHEDLVVTPHENGRTGTVSFSAKLVVHHKDGKVVDQSSVAIVQVGEKDGKRILLSLVEATLEKTRV
ncbi:hypothetical protein B0H11DRAFT_1980734 [Mycena galericulata]|nr:hypothetical protein B0H11DRAFT_1980734 [Mycena galericulata]